MDLQLQGKKALVIDASSLVAFLSSPKAEFITGTTVTIDGGAVRKY